MTAREQIFQLLHESELPLSAMQISNITGHTDKTVRRVLSCPEVISASMPVGKHGQFVRVYTLYPNRIPLTATSNAERKSCGAPAKKIDHAAAAISKAREHHGNPFAQLHWGAT